MRIRPQLTPSKPIISSGTSQIHWKVLRANMGSIFHKGNSYRVPYRLFEHLPGDDMHRYHPEPQADCERSVLCCEELFSYKTVHNMFKTHETAIAAKFQFITRFLKNMKASPPLLVAFLVKPDYSEKNVTQLGAILKDRGLKAKGRKVDLIKRIEDSDEEMLHNPDDQAHYRVSDGDRLIDPLLRISQPAPSRDGIHSATLLPDYIPSSARDSPTPRTSTPSTWAFRLKWSAQRLFNPRFNVLNAPNVLPHPGSYLPDRELLVHVWMWIVQQDADGQCRVNPLPPAPESRFLFASNAHHRDVFVCPEHFYRFSVEIHNLSSEAASDRPVLAGNPDDAPEEEITGESGLVGVQGDVELMDTAVGALQYEAVMGGAGDDMRGSRWFTDHAGR